jgi:triacylglycerol lipase
VTPIVLQHGLFGFGNFGIGNLRLSYFHKIDRALSRRGHPLIVSQVHPTGSIEKRAAQLKRTIIEQCDLQKINERVVIVGHSMGGLDARYMITHLGMADRVAALVTISAPHRGSPYADWCLLNLGKRLGGLKLVRLLRLDVQAIADLTTTSCAAFNEQVPDHRDVQYFSVSAARAWHHIPPFLLHSYKLIYDLEGDNDGLVSIRSATWGQHLETWPADHLHVINKRFVPEIRNKTGDIVPYYLKMIDRVNEVGRLTA